jgi:hypothetical protein
VKSVKDMMLERQHNLAKLLALIERWEQDGYTKCAHDLRLAIKTSTEIEFVNDLCE